MIRRHFRCRFSPAIFTHYFRLAIITPSAIELLSFSPPEAAADAGLLLRWLLIRCFTPCALRYAITPPLMMLVSMFTPFLRFRRCRYFSLILLMAFSPPLSSYFRLPIEAFSFRHAIAATPPQRHIERHYAAGWRCHYFRHFRIQSYDAATPPLRRFSLARPAVALLPQS
jgi:hypothetical protein